MRNERSRNYTNATDELKIQISITGLNEAEKVEVAEKFKNANRKILNKYKYAREGKEVVASKGYS